MPNEVTTGPKAHYKFIIARFCFSNFRSISLSVTFFSNESFIIDPLMRSGDYLLAAYGICVWLTDLIEMQNQVGFFSGWTVLVFSLTVNWSNGSRSLSKSMSWS